MLKSSLRSAPSRWLGKHDSELCLIDMETGEIICIIGTRHTPSWNERNGYTRNYYRQFA